MCFKNIFTINVETPSLETNEILLDSSDEDSEFDPSDNEVIKLFGLNKTIEDYHEIRDEYCELINETIHIFGNFYKLPLNNARICTSCYLSIPVSFRNGLGFYEYHIVYNNILQFDAEIIDTEYKFFCDFCSKYLYMIEYAHEMDCDECTHEMNIQDSRDYFISECIEFIFSKPDIFST